MFEALLGAGSGGLDIAPVLNRWTALSPGVAAYAVAVAAWDGKLFTFGGYSSAAGAMKRTRCYDIATDTWSEKTDIPGTVRYHTAVTIGDKIYLYGGMVDGVVSGKVYIYDPVANNWGNGAVGLVSHSHAAAVIDGMMYAYGGKPDNVIGTGHGAVRRYNPILNNWTTIRNTYVVVSAAMAAINNKLYTDGGFYQANISGSWQTLYRQKLVVDDPINMTLTTKDLPFAQSKHSAVSVGDYLYTFGGTQPAIVKALRRYSARTDKWIILTPRATQASDLAMATWDGIVYTFGGMNSNSEAISELWKYEL